jgi:hypothetical protein
MALRFGQESLNDRITIQHVVIIESLASARDFEQTRLIGFISDNMETLSPEAPSMLM